MIKTIWRGHGLGRPRGRTTRTPWRVHIGPSLGSVRLRSLTPARVRRFLAERTEAGLAANSVRIIHATLRTMLAEAVRDELVERTWRPSSVVLVLIMRRSSRGRRGRDVSGCRQCALAVGAVRGGVAVGLRRGEL